LRFVVQEHDVRPDVDQRAQGADDGVGDAIVVDVSVGNVGFGVDERALVFVARDLRSRSPGALPRRIDDVIAGSALVLTEIEYAY